MNNQINSLQSFQVVAVHRVTGRPQFANVTAPSQLDADDFVADVQSDWLVIRDNADLHLESCDLCDTTENVSTWQLGSFGHESLCENCREDLLEKI